VSADDTVATCAELARRALSVKKRLLAMCKKANAGHIGSSLSCAEILVFLRFAWMRGDDTFVLSKGHAAAALYSLLAEAGLLSEQQIDSFYQDGTELPALPPFNTLPQVPFATGSLGHGLSLSAGMALGARLERQQRQFFCVTSDGELDAGSVWEAALFIAHHRLDNLVWIIDRNRIQAIGRTEDVLGLEPLDAKLRAFGYHVLTVDGHDFRSLVSARDEYARARSSGAVQPFAIIADTVKGNGVGFMRDSVASHYLAMTDSQYDQALTELERDHALRSLDDRNAR